MTLIDRTGMPIEDTCWYQKDDALEQTPRSIVRLADWQAYRSQFGQRAAGTWVQGDQEVADLISVLGDVDVIVIEFPKSRDGRGFSLARLLRERHHYEGDVRAAGPLLPDQFSMLIQCGYTSLISPPSVPLGRWQEAAATQRVSRPRTLLDRLTQER
ncbi:hypothetical protein WQE_05092 [Paraburkholderia hospita]|uniref:Oxidoreductase n=1 Tax=Paraburkholderia hospita TaxID=169430 RepID=A0ABN0FTM1_9BURK|nr:DUF934 domain-containing protein [Paraburkholderia hospita]EIN02183.1 hypothetical protein WQE_05092 [Paraburkholderia hospita]OUL90144.1 hypothetical protein CA602_07235 [Paraburkholderia hospita]